MSKPVDPQPDPPALKAIRGNVTYSVTGATAWFMVPRVRHSFRSDQERDQRGIDVGLRFASLTGCWITQRSTSRPWSVDGWRDRMQADAIRPLEGYGDHLDATAKHLRGRAHAAKLTYLGVSLNRPMPGVTQALDAMRLHGAAERVAKREDGALASQVAEVTRAVSGAGLNARPASSTEVQWLVRRSVALGCPPPEQLPAMPGDWETTDIEQLADTAWPTVVPFGRTVKMVCEAGGRQVVRYVCVSSFGRTDELETTSAWLARTDQLGFAVETSVRAKILPAEVTVKRVRGWLDRIKYQKQHHEDHDEEPPHNLAQAHAYGMQIQDEIKPGATGLATRCDVWVRMAVSGRTEDEALDRARQLHDLYLPDVDVVRKRRGQYRLVKEFIPEEPLASTAFKRTMSVRVLGSGMLASSSAVGHEIGVHLGHTASGANRLPVFWHPWRSMEEREGKGVTTVHAQPGAGKSYLVGSKIIIPCVRAGIHTTVLDPARQLAAICDLFPNDSIHIDLLSATPGICSPYSVLPDPIRDHFESDEEWRHALTMTQASRQQNAYDALLGLLPTSTAEKTETETALSDATDAVPGYPQNSLLEVLGQLQGAGGHAATVGRMLERISKLPAAQLLFRSGHALSAAGRPLESYVLIVISMKGMQLPDRNTPRKDWTTAERMSSVVLGQAAHLTQRSIQMRPKSDRKLVVIDEAHHLERDSAGRLFMHTNGRQARPNNVRFIVISQGAAELARIFDGADLIDSSFAGRTLDIRSSENQDNNPQRAALRSLGIPVGVGYEKVLGTLSAQDRGSDGRLGYREFIFSDGEDGVERIVVTNDGLTDAERAALDTTAAPLVEKLPAQVVRLSA